MQAYSPPQGACDLGGYSDTQIGLSDNQIRSGGAAAVASVEYLVKHGSNPTE